MMYAIQLDMYQAAAVAALVLLLGRFLVRNLDLLRRYCIPEPVAGGVVFALAHLALRQAGILEISFDSTLQTFFMVVFFCSVGFTACFRLLKKGGLQVLLFLGIAVMMCVLQNGLGAFIASAFGLDPRLGLATAPSPWWEATGLRPPSAAPGKGRSLRSQRRCHRFRHLRAGGRLCDRRPHGCIPDPPEKSALL